MFFTACYASFMIVLLAHMFTLKRSVLVENRQPHGYVVIKGTKYLVPFRAERTAISLPITDPISFLLVSHTEYDECFVTALLKLAMSIILLVFMWDFNFLEPFNIKSLKLVRVIGSLTFLLIFAELIKNAYTENWVTGLGDYKYHNALDTSVYFIGLFLTGLIVSSYIKAVKNHRELELTV